MLPHITIPKSYNYIAAFLTLKCNLRCSYCINRNDSTSTWKHGHMGSQQWIEGLNRLTSRSDLPITLQGGEPSIYREWIDVIRGINPSLNIDLLTNLQFDIREFKARVKPDRLRREAPYASIRVSYHPERMDLMNTIYKVQDLLAAGYSVGIWSVNHPMYKGEINRAKVLCKNFGIDFRLKEYLSTKHGTYKYPDACDQKERKTVHCKPTELIIGPTGYVYRCHADLYAGRDHYSHILDPNLAISEEFRPCENYGFCNPCDIKVKTNRFQEFGHTSVEIIKGKEVK